VQDKKCEDTGTWLVITGNFNDCINWSTRSR
jgi:hypothetical protein